MSRFGLAVEAGKQKDLASTLLSLQKLWSVDIVL